MAVMPLCKGLGFIFNDFWDLPPTTLEETMMKNLVLEKETIPKAKSRLDKSSAGTSSGDTSSGNTDARCDKSLPELLTELDAGHAKMLDFISSASLVDFLYFVVEYQYSRKFGNLPFGTNTLAK